MSFDEYQKSDSAMCMHNDFNRKIYEAGAQSRQAEIDELQAMYEKQGLYAFELQKRIDDLKAFCIKGVESNMLSIEYNQALIDMYKILKGDQS